MVKKRVVLVGNGYFGSLYRERIARHDKFDLVGVVDKDISKLRSLTAMTVGESYSVLADSVEHDAVVVCTTPEKHYDIATEALGLKKHVLCMKPGALDEYQYAGIANLVSDAVTFNVDYTLLRAPEFNYWSSMVLTHGSALDVTFTRRVATSQKPEGCVLDLLPHDVALFFDSGLFFPDEFVVRARGDESSMSVEFFKNEFIDAHRLASFACGYDAIWPMKRATVRVKPDADVSNHAIDVEWDQIARSVTTASLGNKLSVFFKHDPDPITRSLDQWEWSMAFGLSRLELFRSVMRVLGAIRESARDESVVLVRL